MDLRRIAVGILAAAVALTVAVEAWAQPFGYSINSRGDFPDNQMVNALWRVDLATGQVEYVGWTGWLDVEALAFDSQQRLFGADDDTNTLVRIGVNTGNTFAVNNTIHNMGIPLGQVMDFGMSFTCDGRLMVVSDHQRSLFEANLETGQLTRIGDAGSMGAPVTDIAVWGNQVYGIGQGLNASGNPDSPFLYSVDLEAATAQVIGPLGSAASPYNNAGLSFDAEGKLWAITDRRAVPGGDFPSEILRIDLATGQATHVADAGIVGLESLAIGPPGGCDPAGEPEPPGGEYRQIPTLSTAGLALLLALLGLIAAFHLRR